MTRRAKFVVWVLVLYAAALAVCAALGVMLGTGLPPPDQEAFFRILSERAPVLAFAAAILLFVCVGAVRWLFGEYVTALHALAEQTGVVHAANETLRVGTQGAREVAEAAAAINRLADAHRSLRRELDQRVQESGARLAEERNRLAALMSELAEGVLVCSAEGRILLYNEQARSLFAPGAASASAPVGLGRSAFALIDRDQIAHALEKLERQLRPGEALPVTRFVTATAAGRLLKVRAAPFVDSGGAVAGVVLALEDVTALLDQEASRRALLQALAAGVRAPVANIRAAAENLASFPDMEPERRHRFVDIVATESQVLSQRLDEALREYADTLKANLALEDMLAPDLLNGARQRIQATLGVAAELGAVDESLWIRVDSFAFVQALAFLAGRLRDDYGVRSLRLSARRAGRLAELDIEWAAAIVAREALSRWEAEPMQIGAEQTPLTLRDVLERHGAEVWFQTAGPGGALFRFVVPTGEPAPALARAPAAPGESRPEYYDFDLFRGSDLSKALQERKLAELAYTAFDTETTGLEPSAGDEIISIGAVRIVNGRLLKNEVFEQLVDPRRALNRESARVHGIEARALEGQPAIERVLPAFHGFCEDTVLVAHNAAFDMRFLELKEANAGVRFTQPVLDTLLLSAAVHPAQGDHRLESIAERLGVRIIGRHTALGDALLTGEIFLKLIPLLAERGVVTLGQALEASRETYYARLQY
ncbi:MAG: exonuclease domain-containing protein [Burkholderiales bacterium]